MILQTGTSEAGKGLQRLERTSDSLVILPYGSIPGLAWESRTGSRTAAIRLFFPGGSSLDGGRPGISHVLEHILASGNGSPDGRKYRAMVASAGAIVRGETAREYISIGIECRADKWQLALRALAAFIRHACPEPKALQLATRNVLAEAISQSSHRSFIWNVMAELMWGNHPLGRSTVGDPDVLRHLTADQISTHLRTTTVKGGVWIGTCGIPDLDTLRTEMETLDWGLNSGSVPDIPGPRLPDKGQRLDLDRNIACSYVVLAWPTPGGFGLEAQALRLRESSLGGPEGTLAKAMRRASMGEDVYAGAGMYRRAGYLAVWAKCLPADEEKVVSLVTETVSAMPKKMDLERARKAYETRTWIGLESSYRMAGAAAIHAMTGGPTPTEWVKRVTSVDLSQVEETAAMYFRSEQAFVVVIRPAQSRKENLQV